MAGTGGAALLGGPALAAPAGVRAGGASPPLGPVVIGKDDPRYGYLTTRGANGRFTGRPDSVRLVGSPDQVVQVVGEAMRGGGRVAVRSGGHCFENFVDDPAVRVVIDTSEMNAVYFDPRYQAFAVETGATLGEIYRTLYLGWGVTIPGGACPSVGAGGHIAGGGYGALSRSHGVVADHLYGVDIVVVDRSGNPRRVVATRDSTGPERDLWWAHTGGGGGNFGIVTRYLLRSPQARGRNPADLLPKPPRTYRYCSITWQWDDMNEADFSRLVRNFGAWHEKDAAGPSPYDGLGGGITLSHRESGQPIMVWVHLDEAVPDADRLLRRYAEAVTKDVGAAHQSGFGSQQWIDSALYQGSSWGRVEFKTKAALQRKAWTDAQIGAVHRFLTEGGGTRWGTLVSLSLFGGKINTVPSAATAMAHRDALFMALYDTAWVDAAERDPQLAMMRRLYKEMYAGTGGVPAPGPVNSGAYINYPDVDLADPEWNTSGVPWHALYYRDNYRRLQQVKAHWDPRDAFRHALAIRPSN
ncbi:FAD-linked oxidase [Actinomadura craniellae]|uniref:FAD-linked oxidase n=2 Tax=Actinomadura craniellae TaxID=2231787 RepID=A0A365H109_9ACTN|nr:FAD-linked oxidase [Actinomadura craniellae]